MPVKGRKPKPEGQAKNRNRPTHEWTMVEDVAFKGYRPRLPEKRLSGRPWPEQTKRWWKAVSTMPHCILWGPSDWSFAIDTALIAAEFHDGDTARATELRHREKVLGTTDDYRRDLRIRYVKPGAQVSEEPTAPAEAAQVTKLDDYRDLYGSG